MAFVYGKVRDQGLAAIKADGIVLLICTAEPSTYNEAVAYAIGSKKYLSIDGPFTAPNGRKVTIPIISDGMVTVDGRAVAWALTNDKGTLVAADTLQAAQDVLQNNTFTLPAIDINVVMSIEATS